MAEFHAASAYAHSLTTHAHKQSTLAKDLMAHEDHMTAAKAHKAASKAHKQAAAALNEQAGIRDTNKRPMGKGVSSSLKDTFSKPTIHTAIPGLASFTKSIHGKK